MSVVGDIENVASSIFDWITGGLGSIGESIENTAQGLFSLGEWVYRAFVDGLTEIYNAIVSLANKIKEALITAYDYLREGLSAIGSYLKDGLVAIASAIKNALVTAYDYLKTALVTIGEKIYNALVEIANVLKNVAHWIWDKLVDLAHWIYDKLKAFVKFILGILWRIISGVADIFERFFNWIKGKLYQFYKDMATGVGGYFSDLLTTAKEKFAEMTAFNITWTGIEAGIPKILNGDYKNGVRHLLLAPVLGALSGAFVQALLQDKKPSAEKLIFAPTFTDMEQYDVFNIEEGSYIEAYGSLKFVGYATVTLGESTEPVEIYVTTPIVLGSYVTIKLVEPIQIFVTTPIAFGSYVDIQIVQQGGGYYNYNYSSSQSSPTIPPNVHEIPT